MSYWPLRRLPAGSKCAERGTLLRWRRLKTLITAATSRLFTTAASASTPRPARPGIVALLDPVRSRNGLVLELGCGSGLLTRELTAAGHRVIATDASPAMLDLARSHAPDAEDIRPLVLPGDVLPQADAVVSVGHVLSPAR